MGIWFARVFFLLALAFTGLGIVAEVKAQKLAALALSGQAYTLAAIFLVGGAVVHALVAGFDRLALLQGEEPPVRLNRRAHKEDVIRF